jgi:predicted DNA-binding protein (UPF0251 family)
MNLPIDPTATEFFYPDAQQEITACEVRRETDFLPTETLSMKMILTARQKFAYKLRRKGLKDADAAKTMGISRSAFNELYHRAEQRVAYVKSLIIRAARDPERLEEFLGLS